MSQKSEQKDWNKILLQNLQKSLILSVEEKEYWRNTLPVLPPVVVQLIGEQLENSNTKIDQFIKLALDKDTSHELLNELKTIIKKTTRNIHTAKEKSEAEKVEQKIEKEIKKL